MKTTPRASEPGQTSKLWNLRVDLAQVADRVAALTPADFRLLVVDSDGRAPLDEIDKLAAALADAREQTRKALFDLGY